VRTNVIVLSFILIASAAPTSSGALDVAGNWITEEFAWRDWPPARLCMTFRTDGTAEFTVVIAGDALGRVSGSYASVDGELRVWRADFPIVDIRPIELVGDRLTIHSPRELTADAPIVLRRVLALPPECTSWVVPLSREAPDQSSSTSSATTAR
jgi:hypothetical protein